MLGVLAGGILYAVLTHSGNPDRPFASLATAEGVAQRAINLLTTRTRRGLPSFRVSARESLTFKEGGMELHDVVVTLFGPGEDETEVRAPMARSGGEEGSGWSFTNGVEVRGENGLELRVPELKYRESPQEISADGDVQFKRGEIEGRARGLRYFVGRRRLEFLSQVDVRSSTPAAAFKRIKAGSASLDQSSSQATFRRYQLEGGPGEGIEGTELVVHLEGSPGRARRLEASGGFTAAGSAGSTEAGILGKGTRGLSGGSLRVTLSETGSVEGIRAEREVRLLTEEPGGGARTLACGRLDVGFENGRASTLTAEETAALTIPHVGGRPESEGGSVRAQTLRASLSQTDGSLRTVEASGSASAQDGGRKLAADRIRYEAASGAWLLEGSATVPARAEGDGVVIAATRINIQRADGTLIAKGAVKTTTLPRNPARGDAKAGGTPGVDPPPGVGATGLFGGGDAPVHGMCEHLTLSRAGRTARYREKVRIWQEGSSVEAAAVDLIDETGTLEAHGTVIARIPSKSSTSGPPALMTISAEALRYSRQSSAAVFTGGVRAVSEAIRIDAASLTAKAGASGEGIREILASGSVRFMKGTRSGDGDVLTAFLREERFILAGRGRLATIQDQSSQQVVKGAVLTYEGSADRILVESETGGRTWITLKPRASEGKRSGP